MDLTDYRNNETEKLRVSDLMNLVPNGLETVLDVGARDGHLSKELANYLLKVTALDLDLPVIDHPQVKCIKGDATAMEFADRAFDIVFCAEVLEHIPSIMLPKACMEIERVAKSHILIGVPYKQDTRHGRTTCRSCGANNPPWGHVNEFDEKSLKQLFPAFDIVRVSYVGEAEMGTNFLSAFLMNKAGNPYGTYHQEEPCVHCGIKLEEPPARTLNQKIMTKVGHYARRVQSVFHRKHANWIHVLFKRTT